MTATPLIRSILLVLLAGALTAGAPIRAAAPRLQPVRAPITPANVAQIIDLGTVLDSPRSLQQMNWTIADELVMISGLGEDEEITFHSLADLYPVTLRSDDLLTVSPDRTQIAVLNIDPYEADLFELHVYTLGGELLPQNADVYVAFQGTPTLLAYSPDGAQIVVVSYVEDMSIIFRLNAQTGELLGRDEIPGRLNGLSYTPDNTQIAIGYDGGLMLLAIDVVQMIPVWERPLAFILDVKVIGDVMIVTRGDGSISAWALADGEPLWKTAEGELVTGWDVSPAGDVLAIGRSGGTLEFYDPANGTWIAALPGSGDMVNSLAFNADGSLLAVATKHIPVNDPNLVGPGCSLHLWGLPEGTASGDGPASGDSSDDGPPDSGGELGGPASTPAGPPTDGTYPLDPPGESS